MLKRILLVDDECAIRESLSKTLEAENYEVILAENGQEAIERHGLQRIDLLIVDFNLTIQNAWASLEWLADVNPLLPVVIVTSRSTQDDWARTAGIDDLMEKPLNVPLLLDRIRTWIGETIEKHAERASQRDSGFRYMPCDDWQLREMHLMRFTR